MITCAFEDGNPAQLRHVTVNGILVKEGSVLLARRGTYNGGKPMLEGGKWGLIGGFVNRDENLEEALKREIQEEIGCNVINLKLFHIKDNPDRPAEDRQNIEFVFIAEVEGDVSDDDEEVAELQWFSLDSLPDKSEMAFDHSDDLEMYVVFIKNNFALPALGKYSAK